ncbi:hypothetical protein LP414_23740 [Polaromonas sp. P1(28)-13]|nr:hypothetical protein LP414_23740 [Polaromonas sp. P1(28)-13]
MSCVLTWTRPKRVLNKMTLRRNAEVAAQPLKLDGEELNLSRVLVNGQGTSFKMEGNQLVLDNLPDEFELEIFTTTCPAKNTKLMGLYVSNDSFFTQCEAEGFRRITYFLDRPDVMASYSVTLRANKAQYPVLLSNGNLVEQGNLEDGRHFAKWVDPHKNPAIYLPWWRASWSAASSASPRARAKSTPCRSTCARVISTRPSTP